MVDIRFNREKMDVSVIGKCTTPLCFLADGSLLCYHQRKVIVMRDGNKVKSISMPVSILERLFGWNRLASRLMRFGVRTAEAIDDNHAVLCVGHKLYEIDVEKGKVSDGWFCGNGIRPLIMSHINGIKSFEDGVYFGGYMVNREKNPISVYRRVGVDQWEVVFTFPEGEINHIHNVVQDKYRQCLWIFTGDFDESAAIWKATEGFAKVERVVCNNQKYRGCVVYALPEGLLYATDAPYAENYIYMMNPETFDVQSICPLHGSCIYGCQWNDEYVFSSTVEGDGRTAGCIRLFYNNKRRGAGIKDDYAHLYSGNPKDGFREIYKEKKDRLSFLFQFAVFKFPSGQNKTDVLYFQPMATRENDMRMMALKK